MKNNRILVTIAGLLLLVLLSGPLRAAVKLPRLVSNGMVLQRNKTIRIWGWADAGEKVEVEFVDKNYKTRADKNGNWQLELKTMAAGGPYSMKINEIELSNILVGDVWLASGQSNMELWLSRVTDLYADEINRIDNPNIRFFRSSTRENAEVAKNDYPDGKWLPATQENVREFSAVAYFFASKIHEQENVPVGIISTAIGGAPAEAWLSEEKAMPFLKEWLEAKNKIDADKKKQTGAGKAFNWWYEVNKNDPGVGKWSTATVDVSGWPQISLPGYWNDKGIELRSGSIWFCREFELPDSLLGQNAVLRLGRIIDSDSAFVNGVFVGNVTYQYPPRIYPISKEVLKAGTNRIMVRVFCPGNRGGFVEEKPYEIRIGKQRIDITGDWYWHVGAELEPPHSAGNGLSFRPGGLFNALINPIKKLALKGVIWYQGESNTGRAEEYTQLFKDLILDWRTQLKQPEMPFLYVQLANLGLPCKEPVESGWAILRDAQRRALELPNTGMAVAFDLGEWNDIHPLNKKEVARRLALEAQRVAYGAKGIVSSGPLYKSMKIQNHAVILSFSSVGEGLYANNLLNGFQIAGDDEKFVWAKAVVLNKSTVKVWSDRVLHPRAVRYAWEDNPQYANLKNKAGLPASPFTTENE